MVSHFGFWLTNEFHIPAAKVALESTEIRGNIIVTDLPKIETQLNGYLRITQILALIPIGRSTWWAWVASEKAPKPIKLGPRTTVWRVEDIKRFIQELNRQGGDS